MDGDKAPGSNGFTIASFQSCWIVVREDALQFFTEYLDKDMFEKSLNATFVTWIPKKSECNLSEGFQAY
jgi:hypothetical protein